MPVQPARALIPRSGSPQAPSVRRNREPEIVVRPLAVAAGPAPQPRRMVWVVDPDQLVSLAATGRCFHADTCRFVTAGGEPILLELIRARQRGLRPCGVCNIEALTERRQIQVDELEDRARWGNLRRVNHEYVAPNMD